MVQGKAALDMPRELQQARTTTASPAAADGAVANLNEASASAAAGDGAAARRGDGAEASNSAAAEAAEAVMRTSYASAESDRAFRHIVDFHTKQGWISMNQLDS